MSEQICKYTDIICTKCAPGTEQTLNQLSYVIVAQAPHRLSTHPIVSDTQRLPGQVLQFP